MKKRGYAMERTIAWKTWWRQALDAVWQTIQAPQWVLLLLVVFLGLASNAEAELLVLLIGLLIALALCTGAAVALGYDGGNPLSFLLQFGKITWKKIALATILLIVALGVVAVTGRSGDYADSLLRKMPTSLAPNPNQSLTVVFLSCIAFTAFSIIMLVVRKQLLRRMKQQPLELMNRKLRRANRVTKQNYEAFKKQQLMALERHDYWTEASLVLGLAAVAALPGALGWTWLWGVALSIVLPMLVLSVRFRMKNG
jgi:hypothetical protein